MHFLTLRLGFFLLTSEAQSRKRKREKVVTQRPFFQAQHTHDESEHDSTVDKNHEKVSFSNKTEQLRENSNWYFMLFVKYRILTNMRLFVDFNPLCDSKQPNFLCVIRRRQKRSFFAWSLGDTFVKNKGKRNRMWCKKNISF